MLMNNVGARRRTGGKNEGCTALIAAALLDKEDAAKIIIGACRRRRVGVNQQTVRKRKGGERPSCLWTPTNSCLLASPNGEVVRAWA